MYNYNDAADSAQWDYTNAQLSAVSTTKVFSVIANDTLSFYRDLCWLDNTTGGAVNASKFVSADAISTSTELVRASDGSRILLIDTVHISSTTTSKHPCIYSWKPLMARIGFLVPASVTSATDVFVRYNVFSTGIGSTAFMRSDALLYQRSKQNLESTYWQDYVTQVVQQNDCSPVCYFSVSANTSPRRITVDVYDNQQSINQVNIYDIRGNLVNSTALPAPEPYTVYPTEAGTYIIVGMANQEVLCSRIEMIH